MGKLKAINEYAKRKPSLEDLYIIAEILIIDASELLVKINIENGK